jgi:hypothetical protein
MQGQLFTAQDLARTLKDLENTYLIRTFSVFEEILRNYWRVGCHKTSQPRMYHLLRSIASRCHMDSDFILKKPLFLIPYPWRMFVAG